MKTQFENNKEKILAEMKKRLPKALEAVGQVAETYAKEKCPVGTPESTGIPGYIGRNIARKYYTRPNK
ncbi:MAG: hypothetical protein RR662_05260 [Clostridia bacterium]